MYESMGKKSIAYMVLVGKAEGAGLCGRPDHR